MDGTTPAADNADPLSDAAVALMRAHPQFLEAARAHARQALAEFDCQDAATRWMFKDLGRASLYMAALILEGWPAGVTVAGLTASAAASGTASRGRVSAFVQYAQAAGRIVAPPGSLPWTQRRLILTPAFREPCRRSLRGYMAVAALVAPEIGAALPVLATDAGADAAVTRVGLLLVTRPELSRNPDDPLRRIFIARDGGMRVLQHLVAGQPPGGERLLEAAVLNRADLARRYGVSRTHLNRLMAEAEAAGVLSFAAADRVVFTAEFSEALEAYVAGQFQLLRMVAGSLAAAA